MLDNVKEFFDLGAALLLLKVKSKAPIETGWTKRPRAKWPELKGAYRPGMNVGVRLGLVSKIGGKYLACIDCDVKSSSLSDIKKMEESLSELSSTTGIKDNINGVTASTVMSGRGNRSRHIYFLSEKPVSPRLWARSDKRVEVMIGGKTVSRPAWEISLMGEGQQVVLPPSVHPDSGKCYRWVKGKPPRVVDIPVGSVESEAHTTNEVCNNNFSFEVVEVDLDALGLSSESRNIILEGAEEGTRSEALYRIVHELVALGCDDNAILSLLTDREYAFSEIGYRHRQTESRKNAAKWIWSQTLRKVRRETDFASAFEDEVVESEKLVGSELDEFMSEFESLAGDWKKKLDRDKKTFKIKSSLRNVRLILENEFGADLVRFNAFAHQITYTLDVPWGCKAGQEYNFDNDMPSLKNWFGEVWRFEPGKEVIDDALRHLGRANSFHPVREYLETLEWDGVERVNTWLKDYLGAEAPEPYLADVSRKTLLAMVRRVMEPGCKFDHVLVLEGGQGLGKSTALSILASDKYFTDAALDPKDKDSIQIMQGQWIVEQGEMQNMKGSDVDSWKAFVTRRVDRARAAYMRVPANIPRQCVFIGTVNPPFHFKDESGNRRIWIVVVKGLKHFKNQINFDGLRAVRDQLFAETYFRYQNFEEPLWLENEGAKQALEVQNDRLAEDPMKVILEDFFTTEEGQKMADEGFQSLDLFERVDKLGKYDSARDDRANQMRLALALRRLGFDNPRIRKKGGRNRYWTKVEER